MVPKGLIRVPTTLMAVLAMILATEVVLETLRMMVAPTMI